MSANTSVSAPRVIIVVGPPPIDTCDDPVGAISIATQIRRSIPNMFAALGTPDKRRPYVKTPSR